MISFLGKLLNIVFHFIFFVILALVFFYSVMYGIKLMSYRQEVITPEIKGKSVQRALEILRSSKLGMMLLEEQYNSFVPAGMIITQIPSPGLKIKADQNIRVIVSKGKESLKVPDLVGRNRKSAELTLERYSLKKGETIFVNSPDIKQDHIIAQNPSPDTFVDKGDMVDLLISKGLADKDYVMPDLINLDMNMALTKLKILHINLDRIIYRYNENYRENLVIDQSPEMGYSVSDRMGVILTVNMKTKKKKESDKFFIFTHILPRGYKEREIELVLVTNLVNRRFLKKGVYPSGYYFKHLVYAPSGSEIEFKIDGKLVKRIDVE